MRYFIASVAILVIIVSFCIFNMYYINTTLDEIVKHIDLAEHYYLSGNNDGAQVELTAAVEKWEKHTGYYKTVLYHTHLDDISIMLNSVADGYTESDEQKKSVAEIKAMIINIIKLERPTLANIM